MQVLISKRAEGISNNQHTFPVVLGKSWVPNSSSGPQPASSPALG